MSPRPKTTHLRRPEIVDAAIAAIAERGFQDVRISDIAERAGTSSAAVLYHFESKEEILDEAVSQAEDVFYAEVEAANQNPGRATARLLVLLEGGGRVDPGGADAMWRLWLEIWVRALRDRHTARTRQLLDRRWRATLADTIRDGQAQGEFSAAADPDLVALQLASLMDGLAIQLALGDPAVNGDLMTEVLIATAEQALACNLGHDGRRDTADPSVAERKERRVP